MRGVACPRCQGVLEIVERNDRAVKLRCTTCKHPFSVEKRAYEAAEARAAEIEGKKRQRRVYHTDPARGEAVGNRVRRFRLAKGWTQTDLAEACGIAQQTIGSLERGNPHVSMGIVKRVAYALGLTVAQLVSEAKIPELEKD